MPPVAIPQEKARRLRLILSQEQRAGYPDRTIPGGLDQLLARWSQDENPLVLEPPGYGSMTPAQRRRWAAAVHAWLDDGAALPGSAPAGGPDGPSPGPTTRKGAMRKPAAGRKAESGARAVSSGVSSGTSSPAGQPLAPLDAPISALPRVTASTALKLQKLGVETLRDALHFYPRRFVDFSHTPPISAAEPGREATIVGHIWHAAEKSFGPRRKATVATVSDGSGSIRAIWFNQPYLAAQFRTNTKIALSGRVSLYQGQKQMESPEYEVLTPDGGDQTHTGRLIPLYPLTEGLPGRTVRTLVKGVIDAWAPGLQDPLPEGLRERLRLADLPDALRQAHYPDTVRGFAKARRRLAFEELLGVQLWMLKRRIEWQTTPALPIVPAPGFMEGFERSLPFALTGAQRHALRDVFTDLAQEQPMSRLLQGDVGSGKTVVAAAALLAAAAAGRQGALMAPTEILAEQHYRSLTRLLVPSAVEETVAGAGAVQDTHSHLDSARQGGTDNGAPVPGGAPRIALLMGSLTPTAKRRIHQQVVAGEIDILVGTHALIQETVDFSDLALAVIDEQHRFGTAQRLALRRKGRNPHILVMTATPVPRSLALTLYGDLESTIIDAMPPGRQPIATRVLLPDQRPEAEEFVREQIREGRQAFVVCPLIEESEQLQARAATAEHERLAAEVFPELRVGLLHGRMPPVEKEAVMARFRDRDLDILVSTTVIEVGIDVPNASVMLIEAGDRFGLSQLHQLRGRVGRGQYRSYCLVLNESENPEVAERLALMERYADGFRLSEADFRLRGPGTLSGTRQSGLSELRMARLPRDQRLLRRARDEARGILANDPDLTGAHASLQDLLTRLRPSDSADLS